MAVWRVALPVGGSDAYDYLPPAETARAEPGSLVRVPFAQRRLYGIVLDTQADSGLERSRLRRVQSVHEPLLDTVTLALIQFAARHYVYPLGLTLDVALPPGALAPPAPPPQGWQLTPAGEQALATGTVRGVRQQAVLQQLSAAAALPRAELEAPAQVLRSLEERGWLRTCTLDTAPAAAAQIPLTLRPEQRVCADAISLDQGFAAVLLDGPTGSGKTEVYLDRAATVIDRGQQVLMLVPEIGLTPQMIARVQARLGARIGVLHSQRARGERLRIWQAARRGELDLILATRSGVFTPLPRLGLIIVDEEHDGSYKQQDGLRYSARDLAVYRGTLQDCPVLLGSATPALETLANVRSGRYRYLALPAAPQGRLDLRLVDMRALPAREPLSPTLIAAIRQHLAGDGQVFLFLNRRGYAPVLYCAECQWHPPCPRCDSSLVWHRDAGRLRCHHCGTQQSVPTQCPSCDHPELVPVGWGTQRVMEAVQTHFPEVPALRFDRDSLSRRNALEEALSALADNRVRLVVGTQMLAKGHDFPHLSLVAVIDADSGLYSTDFRASEHLGQLLTQVRGRAGRRAQDAVCLIQTRQPTHPHLQAWLRSGYAELAQSLLQERAETGWPPYSRLALIRAEAVAKETVDAFFKSLQAQWLGAAEVDCLGPVPRPRRSGRERAQLLLRSARRGPLQQALQQLKSLLDTAPWARKVRWSIDVDPWNLE